MSRFNQHPLERKFQEDNSLSNRIEDQRIQNIIESDFKDFMEDVHDIQQEGFRWRDMAFCFRYAFRQALRRVNSGEIKHQTKREVTGE